MSDSEAKTHVEICAKLARNAGAKVEISESPLYVAVDIAEAKYFFQGDDAAALLNEVPPMLNREDCILYAASTMWG